MRNALLQRSLGFILLIISPTLALPDVFSPFHDAILGSNTTDELELVKRQSNACPTDYHSCNSLGAPSLCCRSNAVCSADAANHVACCPIGAACTGTIGAGASSTVAATGAGSQSLPVSTTNGAGGIVITTTIYPTNTGSFIIATGAATGAADRPTVQNSYYPYFTIIATTYTDAAACSSAYTSCQTEAAKCTAALGGGDLAAAGVTISAPNGGITVQAPTVTLGAPQASSICSSISLEACSGLQVAACTAFDAGRSGAGSRLRPCGYGVVGAGVVAAGVVGHVL